MGSTTVDTAVLLKGNISFTIYIVQFGFIIFDFFGSRMLEITLCFNLGSGHAVYIFGLSELLVLSYFVSRFPIR